MATTSGDDILAAVYNLRDENHVLEAIQDICCVTIALNTERINRAYVLLEPKLKKNFILDLHTSRYINENRIFCTMHFKRNKCDIARHP